MKRHDRRLLALFFFASGATSLMLQVAWSKQLSYLLGNTLYAVATVVAAFMGGLGLGSTLASRFGARVKNPIRAYAWMEFVIAICGAASVPVFRSLGGMLKTLYALSGNSQGLFLLARFLVVFTITAVPVTLMGMTLPLVIAAIGRRQERYEGGAGYFYGINTFGALAGTLTAGLWMVPALGLLETCLAAGGLDTLVGIGALWLGRQVGEIKDVRVEKQAAMHLKKVKEAPPDIHVPRPGWTPGMLLVGSVYAVSGAVAMIYEVGWFRLLALVLGPSVHAFSMMLAVFLGGLGLGSLTAAKRASRIGQPGAWFAALQAALCLASLLGLALVNRLPIIYSEAFTFMRATWMGQYGYIVAQALTSSVIVFLPTFIMGVMFPIGVRAFRDAAGQGTTPEQAVGIMYAMNTMGSISGSLTAGFFLVPSIGMWRTLALGAGLSLALSTALWFSQWGGAKKRVARLTAATVSASICVGVYAILPPFDANSMNQGSYRKLPNMESSADSLFENDSHLLYYHEGVNTTVAVYGRQGLASLRVSGKPDASTLNMDLYTQIFVGQVPMLFSRNHGRAAVIGYGSGTSAGTMLRYPDLESLDILEIERGVIEASKYFEPINHNPLADPRAHLILDDGRVHMTYTDKVYDVIASEPSNPWMSGVSNLFTVDFYRTARAHLAPGGVFAQWIQLYQISNDTFKAMIASLQEVFPHVAIFLSQPSDAVVLASPDPIRVPWETLERRFALPGVAADFRQVAILKPADLFFYFVASDDVVREFASSAPARNTDDNVWLEHRMTREFFNAKYDLDAKLPEYFPSGKVLGLQNMGQGAPLESVLGDIIAYGYSMEPRFEGNQVQDPLARWRVPVLTSVYADLRQMGHEEIIARLQQREHAESARNINAIKAMQQVYLALNDPAAKRDSSVAKRYIDQANALAPDLPIVMTILGNQAYSERDFGAAEYFYTHVLDKPWSLAYYDSIVGMARVYAQRGDTDHTLGMLERAIGFNPYLPNAYQLAVAVYRQQRNLGKAVEVIHRGLATNPHDALLRTMAEELSAMQLQESRASRP